ncbi:Outer membrane protein beta-barrel domain-containing protein [Hymenobacter gelipurpurascens]|uniref:Outer membrane protein beta-barrel domain-containing protein n=1 Tax=Hymenobacter gelipurpurascens TaxID=89968 RepID=A0A212UH28_9BACT|nr:porin family protein [Hymenobacter gelipurpurascens]SNC77496.1 Outer membrane protein beta-barrel domain-containing protein [Hymenobacter gelipurpurascens]
MKKSFLLFLLVAGVATASQAQNVRVGLKGGASLTNFAGDDAALKGNKVGFHGGLLANIGVNDAFSVQPELLYSQKGSKYTLNGTDVINKFDYIDLPIMFRINADGLFFEVGPQLGFLSSAKQKIGSVTTDIKDAYNTVDFGYAAGLGYQSASGPGIGLRYNGGITNIPKEYTTGNTSFQPNIRNSAFQLYVSYLLGGSSGRRRR